MDKVLRLARAARLAAPPPNSAGYRQYCSALRDALRDGWPQVLAANAEDVQAMTSRRMPATLIDRIRLGAGELAALEALTVEVAAALERLAGTPAVEYRCGPMTVRQLPRPLGVLLMIYEARPTVSIEGALLPVVMGNAVLLRGGSEIAATNRALAPIVGRALAEAGLPEGLVQLLADCDRRELRELLTRDDEIDVLLPRGGPNLIDFCRSTSRIPVIASGGGANHMYVHASADLAEAAGILLDSKLPEPTACNTVETVLCDARSLPALITELVAAATEQGTACTLRVPAEFAVAGSPLVTVEPMAQVDLGREFLDHTLVLYPVAGLPAAVEHIRGYGSRHTEGVLADDPAVVEAFCRQVDAATLVVNGSLRLHDGPTMGIGPEIAISTGRLQVRGPVSLSALATYSWVVHAAGSLRGPSADLPAAAATERV